MKGFSESLKAPAIGIRETPHAIQSPRLRNDPMQSPGCEFSAVQFVGFPHAGLLVFRTLAGRLPWWCQRHAVAFPPHCPLRPYRLTETARPMPNVATVTARLDNR